jgi:hypothetical protein
MRTYSKLRRNINVSFLFSTLLTASVWVCGCPHTVFALSMNPMTDDDVAVMAQTKSYGVNGDQSHIPEMTALLDKSKTLHPYVTYTVLHSLALLGATTAIPKFDAILTTSDPFGLQAYATVQRARLIAESSVDSSNSSGKADAKIGVMLKTLGLKVTDLTPGCKSFYAERLKHSMFPTISVLAIREIADVFYRAGIDPKVSSIGSQIEFTNDPPAEIKARLAGMSNKDRLDWLLADLSNSKNLGVEVAYEKQLASEWGDAAAESADRIVATLDSQASLKNSNSVINLLDVIDGSGSSKRGAIFAQRANDKDTFVTTHIQAILKAEKVPPLQSPPSAHFAPGY